MEPDIEKLRELLLRAYQILMETPDSHAAGDSWHSQKQLELTESIADALDIEENDCW